MPKSFVVDTGAVTLNDQWNNGNLQPLIVPNLISANGSPIAEHGTVNVTISFANIDLPTQVVADGLTDEAIFG